jgi:mono/diheme cytochrome c family protein/glucose/arabinose dehydrogenase
MWNRLHFFAGVSLLAILSVFFSARTVAVQNPPAPAPAVAQPPAGQTPAAPPPTGGTLSSTTNAGADFSPKPPIKPRTPEDEAKSFVLPPGYRMELVVAEPQVVSPAVIRFDGNGRMYVAEFTTYMRDADGNNQHLPESRITRFESTKNDGVYDKRTVFVDKLVLPRTVVPLDGNSILTNETASDDIVKYTDTNNDGVADKREHFYSGIGLGRDGNLEHEQAGFTWGLDNWIYTTYNAFRFRITPSGILKEPTGPNSGSWGVTMDDDGKMWFIDAGGERGPMNFQVPIHYGAFNLTDQYEPGFHAVWPEIGLSDTQGGMVRVRMPVGRLNHLTAASGADVVRAHRVPDDLRGDLLITEPVGRLIRRVRIVKESGLTQLRNAYPGAEFLTSTDPLFRPINITTAPDGSVYVADMYHGIIQESNWTRPGSYLRRKIDQYQLDKVIAHGRIWRLRFDGVPGVPATPAGPAAQATPEIPAQPALPLDMTRPRMLSETPAQLVAHLRHPNGWWRDTAQQLLVLRQDKSVVPALQSMVRSQDNLVARFHALWTLEGLGALDAGLVREQLKDANPRMRVQAIRASETLYKAANRSFADDYRAMTNDSDPDVALQAMLTANLFKLPEIETLIKETLASTTAKGVQEIGRQLLTRIANAATTAAAGYSPAQQEQLKEGEIVYKTLCFSCHGDDGRGVAMAGAGEGVMMAPPLAGSPRVQGHRDYVIKTLLHGMTGPVAGQSFSGQVMLPMGAQNDQWIANIASYVRNSFGNSGAFITPADVARVRAATAARKTPWTHPELEGTLPRLLPADPTWKATASHNAEKAGNGLTLAAWTTAVPQEAGMWFQVELPQPALVAEVQFDAGAPGGRGVGGGRGGQRGQPPAGGPAPRLPRVRPRRRRRQGGVRRPGRCSAASRPAIGWRCPSTGRPGARQWPRGRDRLRPRLRASSRSGLDSSGSRKRTPWTTACRGRYSTSVSTSPGRDERRRGSPERFRRRGGAQSLRSRSESRLTESPGGVLDTGFSQKLIDSDVWRSSCMIDPGHEGLRRAKGHAGYASIR